MVAAVVFWARSTAAECCLPLGAGAGELLDTPPPGIDEAIAIAKLVQFLKDPKYARFTRIVFDTAPTGHTLRLLALPDFLDTSVGKVWRELAVGRKDGHFLKAALLFACGNTIMAPPALHRADPDAAPEDHERDRLGQGDVHGGGYGRRLVFGQIRCLQE